MRKSLYAILLLTALILSGCSVEQTSPQNIEKLTTAISSEESEQLTETETIPSEQVKTESSVDIDESEKSEIESPVQNTEVNSGDSENKPSSEPVNEPSAASEQNKITEQKATDITPTVEEKPKEVTTEETTSAEAEANDPEPAAPFDIDYWISYAKTTAQQNGLSLDSTATDCWDNPITANPNCIYLERDICSRMNRYGIPIYLWLQFIPKPVALIINILVHLEILQYNIFAHMSQFPDCHTLLYRVVGFSCPCFCPYKVLGQG